MVIFHTVAMLVYQRVIAGVKFLVDNHVEIITTSLFSLTGIMVNKRNHPNMALFQVSELL